MQIYTQNPNCARKNMNFFKVNEFFLKSTSQQVNESTSFFGVLKGL